MREYLLVFLVAAAPTYLLTVIAREIALRSARWRGCATATCTPSRSPTSAGSPMLGGLVSAYVVARQLPFLSERARSSSTTPAIVLIAGRA